MSMVDLLIDPEGDNLPEQQLQEKRIHHLMAMTRMQQAHDVVEPWDAEATAMAAMPREEKEAGNNPATDARNITVAESASNRIMEPFAWQREAEDNQCPNLKELCREGYVADKIFHKILEHPEDHKSFEVQNGLIDYAPNLEIRTRCIPHSKFWGRKITKLVLDQVHRTVGHMGPSITEKYADMVKMGTSLLMPTPQ